MRRLTFPRILIVFYGVAVAAALLIYFLTGRNLPIREIILALTFLFLLLYRIHFFLSPQSAAEQSPEPNTRTRRINPRLCWLGLLGLLGILGFFTGEGFLFLFFWFFGFFGFFYACFLLSHIYLVREYTYGKLLVWLAFIAAFGCDTGAYFAGITFGKHKLIPTLSPKKTIEGSIGGIVTATVLALLYGWWLQRSFTMDGVNILLLCGLTGFFGSFLAQIGDLAASAMKRLTGIKDFGKLIPGHGGVLDRFDSVILTAPAVYYIMLFLIDVQV